MGPWCSAGGLFFFKFLFSFSYIYFSLTFLVCSAFIKALSKSLAFRPGTDLFPGTDYSPGNRFKTTSVILAVWQRILSSNTCRGIQLLWPNSCFCLLHLPGKFALAGRNSRGRILLTGEPHFCQWYKLNHAFDTCQGFFKLFTASNRGF